MTAPEGFSTRRRYHRVGFPGASEPQACGFLDPGVVIRAVHRGDSGIRTWKGGRVARRCLYSAAMYHQSCEHERAWDHRLGMLLREYVSISLLNHWYSHDIHDLNKHT